MQGQEQPKKKSRTLVYSRVALRVLLTFALALANYLLQTCVCPYLEILGVIPNLMFAYVAIIIVLYGPMYSYSVCVLYGAILESMLAPLPLINIIAYPILTFISVQFTAYKPVLETSLTISRRKERLRRLRTPMTRAVAGAFLMTLIYEIVFIGFYFLKGIPVTFGSFAAAFFAALYTALCTLPMYRVLWRLLGVAGIVAARQAELQEGANA